MNEQFNPNIQGMSPLLLVADLHKSISFYTQYFGFKLNFQYEDFYAGLIKDGFTIHIKSGIPNKDERAERIKNEDLDIIFSVKEIAKFYNIIQNTSINIIQSLREMPYGQEFYITDPDDYLISFLEVDL